MFALASTLAATLALSSPARALDTNAAGAAFPPSVEKVRGRLPAQEIGREGPAPEPRRQVHGNMPDGIYVRIIPFSHAFRPGWDLEHHNAQDILKMIEELKPDVLNRFINGKQELNLKVPVASGCSEMTELEFLNAALRAGAPGCLMTPKVHLNAIWPDSYRLEAARSLRDLPVSPRLTALDLDCWFTSDDPERNQQELKAFREMGWSNLGFNPGVFKDPYGYASYMMICIDAKQWTVPPVRVARVKEHGIPTVLVHIDYPNQIRLFGSLPPDRQADILTQSICPAQRRLGFRFIYPILYENYDSTRVITSKAGPYHGKTLFEVMKEQIELDRTFKPAAPERSGR